jgi:hypothetical protein
MHSRNARVTKNFCEYNPLKRLAQPPYSPNISLSDVHLFGKVKNAVIGQEIPDEIALLEGGTEILGAFPVTNYRWSFATRLNVSRV